MSRLSDVEIFVQVVDEGGFTAAADAMGLSKSYVSKRVRALEDRMGAALLTRNTRHVATTPLGATFHERCTTALEILDDAERLAQREQDTPRGTLKVSLPLSFGVAWLAEEVARFVAEHDDLTVDATYTDRKVDLVDEGYDLAIRIGHLDDSDLLARRLASSDVWLCGSPAYLDTHGRPEAIEDLQRHDLLVYTLAADPRRWRVLGHDGPVSVAAEGRLAADNGDALVAGAVHGLGLGLFPAWLAWEQVQDGRLERVLCDLPVPSFGIWAVYPPHRHLSAKVTQFVDRVAAWLETPPWAG